MKWLLIGLVRAYQLLVSPLLGQTCRYYPSCSAYAVQALEVHGAVKGTWLAVRRLLRCHPWAAGGVDHVPPRHDHSSATSPDSPDDSPGHSRGRSERSPVPLPASAGGHPSQQGA